MSLSFTATAVHAVTRLQRKCSKLWRNCSYFSYCFSGKFCYNSIILIRVFIMTVTESVYMKDTIETIPVNEAFSSGDECPFCYLERMAEQRTIRYVLGPGASYMEPDVRAVTDVKGFCRGHFKKLYDFGNPLGNALIMQTYYEGLVDELEQVNRKYVMPAKKPLIGKRKATDENTLLQWARQKRSTCFLCDRLEYNMDRYYLTFFALIKKEEFRTLVENSKGFCIHHFSQLLEQAEEKLPNSQREWFYETGMRLMRENLARVKGDIDWFVGMFDYRQAGADWKNSRDAVSRGMQKLQGHYPADKPYKMDP